MERTEEEWKAIAFAYCQAMGLDPNQTVPHGADPDARGFVPAVLLYSPRWQIELRTIKPISVLFDILKSGEAAKSL